MIDLQQFKMHCEYLSLTDLRPYKEVLEAVLNQKIKQNERIREKYKNKIDFVYCNPPCAPWSNLGGAQKGAGAWRDDPRIKCWRDSFNLLYRFNGFIC